MILSPTKELCLQLETQFKQLAAGVPCLKSALLIGGMPIPNQIYRLRNKVQVLICTPGRLIDILDKFPEDLNLDNLKMLVIDEIDEMVSMGFREQIDSVIEKIPSNCQRVLVSATITKSVEKLSQDIFSKHVRVQIDPQKFVFFKLSKSYKF